jgi:hypothetical protein
MFKLYFKITNSQLPKRNSFLAAARVSLSEQQAPNNGTRRTVVDLLTAVVKESLS